MKEYKFQILTSDLGGNYLLDGLLKENLQGKNNIEEIVLQLL
tara:strand:- start:148 stop:273 length:126 start_codon:yes stop_codon:yes gene_type:complete